MYPTDLTPAEAEAGFRLVGIDNPHPYANRPAKIQAVVFDAGQWFRIVKMDHQTHGTWYNLDMYGVLRGIPPFIPQGEDPGWHPVQSYYHCRDPITLTANAVAALAQHPGQSRHYIPRVPPVKEAVA